MGNTYHKMHVQCVFAVKFRKAVIEPEWKPQLLAVIGNLINETGCKTIIANGMEDHVHCFFGITPPLNVSDIMQSVKAKSSKWINESGLLKERFEWQSGYGAFSYSPWDVNMIHHYIANQEEHHTKLTFKEEYLEMLHKHEVDFKEEYIFDDLI